MEPVNQVNANLKPYPMEELARIRADLRERGQPVFDFGTGDPKIPVAAPIRQGLIDSISEVSQYPSVKGIPELAQAQLDYLKRRFDISRFAATDLLPTSGSKEAIFHLALSLVGRSGKKRIAYPDPGYPVYRSSALFAGGDPTPLRLSAEDGYLMQPWELPESVQEEIAGLWVNYPHNPTGSLIDRNYAERLVEWADRVDALLLSDDCYCDIYFAGQPPPFSLTEIESDRILSVFSLSKRSGMTGYRSGFLVGSSSVMAPLARARANFGVAPPEFIQQAAVIAWKDDDHVAERRRIFTDRMETMAPQMIDLGLLHEKPKATFYLWCPVPASFAQDDIRFCLELARHGVIASPSQWLSEGLKGYARFALVPEREQAQEAVGIIAKVCEQGSH